MTVDYNDAMQILEDPKAANWELRDLAKSLLDELQVARAAERERIAKQFEGRSYLGYQMAVEIRALGDQP